MTKVTMPDKTEYQGTELREGFNFLRLRHQRQSIYGFLTNACDNIYLDIIKVKNSHVYVLCRECGYNGWFE